MNIILFQPQIPQNTGNVVRTCSVTGSSLYLVRPLGFSTSSRMLKRAGLDYWDEVDIQYIDRLDAFLTPEKKFYFFSIHGKKSHTEVTYQPNDYLVFGSEVSGLPPLFHEKYPDLFYKVPMKENSRCLNLANTVAIVLYEALRQQKFDFHA